MKTPLVKLKDSELSPRSYHKKYPTKKSGIYFLPCIFSLKTYGMTAVNLYFMFENKVYNGEIFDKGTTNYWLGMSCFILGGANITISNLFYYCNHLELNKHYTPETKRIHSYLVLVANIGSVAATIVGLVSFFLGQKELNYYYSNYN